MCLEVPVANGSDASVPVQAHCDGGAKQLWNFLPAPKKSSFIIRNEATKTALDGGEGDSHHLTLSPRAGSESAMWELVTP